MGHEYEGIAYAIVVGAARVLRRTLRKTKVKLALALVCLVLSVDFWLYNQRIVRSVQIPQSFSSDYDIGAVFIASNLYACEDVLRSGWSAELVRLVTDFLQPENVVLSIYESGSYDGTKDLLIDLDKQLGQLGIRRRILLNDANRIDDMDSVPLDSPGWIDTPQQGARGFRRIPWLAGLRNRALEPLVELRDNGLKMEKILFLNDVRFKVRENQHQRYLAIQTDHG